ncbi:diaminopimelate epimerase [Acidithiobacillus sp. M4-SHS-6]|uniref:diaminopimelate epimerase n=1 Tax=Acidithiobacillus sp. M4-SHS-6 TaxID=3383024 RepID=UPI0039BE0944
MKATHPPALTALHFTKMQGLGNDFVVFDGIRQQVHLAPEQIRAIADRHFGIGCDQVLLVEKPDSSDCDFRYRIFNADGGEVAQCGNGARCLAIFVRRSGLCDKAIIQVETRSGRMQLQILENGEVLVDMGVPRFAPGQIPLRAAEEGPEYLLEVDHDTLRMAALSMGNPHAVLRVPDIRHAPVTRLGPRIENHPDFPQRCNVGFMEICDRTHIRLRVWERGAGETLACGSNACAAVVAGIRWGELDQTVVVDLPGGRLCIQWAGPGQAVMMTGPAQVVFDGTWSLQTDRQAAKGESDHAGHDIARHC